MASCSTTPDTLINLKINHDGISKKLKLPLRDLGASTLEDKLRYALSITPGTEVHFERYSDSAASYVVLDQSNQSVYKQLYRAAKAKQKLKLRVTTKQEEVEEEPKVVPKPVTVEDVPETLESIEPKKTEEPVASPSPSMAPAPTMQKARITTQFQFAPEAQLRAQLKNMARNHEELEKNIAQLEASVANMVKKTPLAPVNCCRGFSRTSGLAGKPLDIPIHTKPEMTQEAPKPQPESCSPQPRATSFAVCCNSCDRTTADSHYHCSTCDDGDFDLCQDCVDMGITCYGADHWLIKRFVKNGMIINSTTERIAPKPKAPKPVAVPAAAAPVDFGTRFPVFDYAPVQTTAVRTCNNCVAELPELEFVHCTVCYDFDLCKACFSKNEHGHHPKHGFIPAAEGSVLSHSVSSRLAPGRNQRHNAICDGCDKFITGVRHKCLDCPDWDYCSDCVINAGFVHPNHRFVPIYEALSETRMLRSFVRPTHGGICCDGPLCTTTSRRNNYIVGDRYKCAVCNDLDFCANCEASPANTHNKTHPLIKFKTPVRHVSVTTTGENGDGSRMPAMGDRSRHSSASSRSQATETTLTSRDISTTNVQTVVDVKPSEPEVKEEVKEIKQEQVEEPATPVVEKQPSAEELVAVYERDTIHDGTILPPNEIFEQTWVLRNAGTVSWPAGCSVKFVGGDYMGHVDSKHPAGISELVSASESTICYKPLAPGQEFHFTVLLRTPARHGKVISYWRLTTKEGLKFGHRLWCDVDVQAPTPKEEPKVVIKEEIEEIPVSNADEPKEVVASPKPNESQMIFPKLEKESPAASIHEQTTTESVTTKVDDEFDDFEECGDDEWAEDASEDGFLTDEEYDILDASDEEYLEEQQKKLLKK